MDILNDVIEDNCMFPHFNVKVEHYVPMTIRNINVNW